jgi:hypothetical protein
MRMRTLALATTLAGSALIMEIASAQSQPAPPPAAPNAAPAQGSAGPSSTNGADAQTDPGAMGSRQR